MDISYLVALLFLVVLSAVLIVAVFSNSKVEKIKKDDRARHATGDRNGHDE
ncbi:MAG: hypothetical protein AB8B62_11220 [Roseobacter sp.]